MASNWEDIGDAIVTSLNAASLSQSFTSSRQYRPNLDLTGLEASSTATVYVIPAARTSTTSSRLPIQTRDYSFDVEIYRFISDPTTAANIDTWMTLAEEIEDHLMQAGGMSDGVWIGSTADDPFDGDLLHDQHLFAAAIRVIYRVKQQ